jgi:hypothetical protein
MPVLPTGLAGLAGRTSIIILVPPALATMTAATAWTVSATSTTRAFRLGSRFIDGQGSSLKILAIEGRNGFGCIFVLSHFHEAEPARFPGIAVSHDLYLLDLSKLAEKRP